MKNNTKKFLVILLSIVLCFSLFGLVACNNDKKNSENPTLNLITNDIQIEVGGSYNIAAEYDGDGRISYSSSNTDILTVSNNGVATGVSLGTAFVTVSVNGQVEICKITVIDTGYTLNLGFSEISVVVGSSLDFNAKLNYKGNEYIDDVIWSVSENNPDKFELQTDGVKAKFISKQVGIYTLTASTSKAQATCVIKVVSETAKRVEQPIISVQNCNTLTWSAVDGATSYDVMIDYGDWVNTTLTQIDISEFVGVDRIKFGQSIDIYVRAMTEGNYDYVDSGISKISFTHDYNMNETQTATCSKAGVMVYTCDNCSATYVDEDYYKPHNYQSGVCTLCKSPRTDSVIYTFDDNYIPMPTPQEANDENSEWRVKYAKAYDLSKVDAASNNSIYLNQALWIQVHTNREKFDSLGITKRQCYYVSGVSDLKVQEIYIAGRYDDGKNGEHEVKYIKGAFSGNCEAKKVVAPIEIDELRGAVFQFNPYIETVIFPGINYLPYCDHSDYGTNNFNSCYSLKQLVFGDGINIIGRNFLVQSDSAGKTREDYESQAEIFVLGDGTNKASITTNYDSDGKQIFNGNIYYQSGQGEAIDACGKWYLTENYEVKIRSHEYENKICIHCGASPDYGMKFAYDSDNDCFYVADGKMVTSEVLKIPATYNDGKIGEKAVKYIGASAFMNNMSIKKVVLPKSVTTLNAGAFFLCKNLEFIAMEGVESITAQNVFFANVNLKTVVIGKSLQVSGSVFHSHTGEPHTPIMSVYATQDGGQVSMSDGVCAEQTCGAKINDLWTGKTFTFDKDLGNCRSWKWTSDKLDVIANESEHIFNEEGICENSSCDELDDSKQVLYGYDSENACYYVYNNPNLNMETVVVASTYDDGVHGVAEVKYLACADANEIGAFEGNTTVKKIILPNTVISLNGDAFVGCTSLTTVIMTGVKYITYGDFNRHGAGYKAFEGDVYAKEYALWTGLKGTVGAYKTGNFSGSAVTKIVVSDTFEICDWQDLSKDITLSTLTFYVEGTDAIVDNGYGEKNYTTRFYDANDACGTWKWANEQKTDIVLAKDHVAGADGYCTNEGCHLVADETKAILYGYDSENECYYVYNNPNLALETIVVPAEFDDGVHGVAEVKYLARLGKIGAFQGNEIVKTIVLNESVISLNGDAFVGCTSLTTVIMTGVKYISYGDFNREYDGYKAFEGDVYASEYELWTGLKGTVGAYKTGNFSGSAVTKIVVSDTFEIGKWQTLSKDITLSTLTFYVEGTDAIVDNGDGEKNYTTVYYSENRPEENQQTTWCYYNGIPTLWINVPQ